jgi:hypothetical protein
MAKISFDDVLVHLDYLKNFGNVKYSAVFDWADRWIIVKELQEELADYINNVYSHVGITHVDVIVTPGTYRPINFKLHFVDEKTKMFYILKYSDVSECLL